MSDITRFRGDTKGFTVTITDTKGDPIPITDCGLKLSVSTEENPTGNTYTLQLDASVSDADNGVFSFEFNNDGSEVDFEGDYFFDLQFTDAAGKISTINKGSWTMTQDITK